MNDEGLAPDTKAPRARLRVRARGSTHYCSHSRLKARPGGGPEEGAGSTCSRGTGRDSASVVSVELLEVELALVSRMIVNL